MVGITGQYTLTGTSENCIYQFRRVPHSI